MDNETIEDFAKYRLSKAKETINTAEMIFKQLSDYTSANNRAYYAIFYAIRAVLALEQTDFKKHKDVIVYFNQHYVNTEIFPKSIGRKIAQAQRIREDSDYDDEYRPSYEKTEQQINTAKELITLVEEYIENKVNNSNDSFHSATNMKRLKKAIKDVEEGKITIHELVEDEDE